jgi:NAD(P)-dependent dehydrogenase (short-subunit alcohol dehydrogenase family)
MSKLALTETFKPGRVWLVTGASRGIGRAVCEYLLEGGESVACTARNPKSVEDLVARYPDQALAVQLDVTSTPSVKAAIDAVIARFGRVDVLLNNAGSGIVGALEEVPEEEVRHAFETNVYGPYRVTQALLPHLRKQRSGHIMNTSSVLGAVTMVGFCFYSAAKFALNGMMETLADEVAPLGIRVTVLEPASFRTEFRKSDAFYVAPQIDDYAQTVGKFRDMLGETDGKQPGDPKRAAKVILAMANAENPPLHLPMGENAVAGIRKLIAKRTAELEEWQELSLATSFVDGK